MQIIYLDNTVRSNTLQDLKVFISHSLATEAEKKRTISFYEAAIKKTIDIMSDEIVKVSTKNESLKNKIGFYDEKWLEESKASL